MAVLPWRQILVSEEVMDALGLDFQEAFYIIFAQAITFLLIWVAATGVVLAAWDIIAHYMTPEGPGDEEW